MIDNVGLNNLDFVKLCELLSLRKDFDIKAEHCQKLLSKVSFVLGLTEGSQDLKKIVLGNVSNADGRDVNLHCL